MTKVFIDGREGTTGLRIMERLSARNDIELLLIDEALRKNADARREMINQSDITFLCLPDAAAKEAVEMADDRVKIIDASTAHRTLPGWAYGFAELSAAHRSAIETGNRIAVPGCHASGFNSLVYPMIASGLMAADYPVTCHSVTGYSGGGKKMIAQYQDENREEELSSPRQYGLTQMHKHLKEMKAVPGLAMEPIFNPIVADYYAGMVVTVPVFTSLLKGKPTLSDIRGMFAAHYAGQKMVKVIEGDEAPGFLGANNLAGRDIMEILITGNDDRVLLTSRFDNLGKGASGAAVQCMNITLGLDETTGLVI
ncbi:MAG: N-acetyl-gamma-glutamyl-phosphate reductase [Clostridia bacterium]|nr:N-acetyl-gamma-glutamyl-phosphate reductase [Clostridia bacterium]